MTLNDLERRNDCRHRAVSAVAELLVYMNVYYRLNRPAKFWILRAHNVQPALYPTMPFTERVRAAAQHSRTVMSTIQRCQARSQKFATREGGGEGLRLIYWRPF